MSAKIPVSVIIVTRNEESRIARCLESVSAFDDVIVVDSQSTDRTKEIATQHGARVYDFVWNGRYPKKRQWCLDHLETKYPWIFFLDADEVMTQDCIEEIRRLDFSKAGYFVRAQHVWEGKTLRHGLCNAKIALFHKDRMCFPVIDDLYLDGMGEIEGHYQPVLSAHAQKEGCPIGILHFSILHTVDDSAVWHARHEKYARWEAGMIRKKAWPQDPVWWRAFLKQCVRGFPWHKYLVFLYTYVLRAGFLDGGAGWDYACGKYQYYARIETLLKNR